MSLKRIFCTRELPKKTLQRLALLFDVEVWPNAEGPSHSVLVEKARSCNALVTLLTDRVDSQVLCQLAPKSIVSQFAVGVDNIDLPAAQRFNVQVTNTPGALTDTVVEVTYTLMLGALHRVGEADRYVRNGQWRVQWHPTMLLGRDIARQTLGIVGMGRIGKRVADIALNGFGAREVLYTSRSDKPELDRRFRRVDVDELCANADIVSVHCALTDDTRHLIDKRRIGLMKSSAVLVNTSRGPVVDQQALAEALRSRAIAAAGLDAFEREPIDLDDPLLRIDNCVLMPHLGSASLATREAMGRMVVDNLEAFFSDQPLISPCWS
jgi:glyoxylate reductase